MNHQKIKNGYLITTTSREITERQAVITDIGNGTYTYSVFSNGIAFPSSPAVWPPEGTTVPENWEALPRLREHLEVCYFGGRVNLGWRRQNDQWLTDTFLGDSGGYGFTESELELIRSHRAGRKAA